MFRFWRVGLGRFVVLACLSAGLSLYASPFLGSSYAQDDGGGDGGDDGGGVDGGGDGGDTTIVTGPLPGAGVVINAQGVLSVSRVADTTGQLSRRRRLEARAALDPNLARASQLRKISLNRLEAAVAKQLADGAGPTDEMQFLAGLTSIQYVFFYPETHDIVIAGPAEGFMLDELTRPIGINTGQAILQLEDMIVALRAFGPGGQPTPTVGVSIDPTQEGLARMQDFLSRIGGRAFPSDTDAIVDGLRESLGLQIVTVNGISPNTHFANVLVEADYRMKLIGIGLEEPPVRMNTYVARANPANVARNAMQRWYFVPDYESVRVSDDGFAAELVGEGVKLVNANELVRGDGTRVQSGNADRASRLFVESFTRNYPRIARKAPVYGQLRNLIDMLIVAAYIQDQDFYGQADWDLQVFGNESLMPVQYYAAPKQVETAVNAIWKGNRLMTPIGGGVHINAHKAISAEYVQPDEEGTVAQQREKVGIPKLADGQWWWD